MKNNHATILNQTSTLILRIAILVIGGMVIALCVATLPAVWMAVGGDREYSDIAFAIRGILAALYIAGVPLFYCLYQALKLLSYIDKNKAFSELSVKALKRIAGCGVAIAIVFAASLPFFYTWAQHDDAPGLILIAASFAGASLVVSVFSTLMQRLLSQAIEIKSENDLTV